MTPFCKAPEAVSVANHFARHATIGAMSTHYETLAHADAYREAFAVEPPPGLGERHLWPRKPGGFIVHAATAALLQGKDDAVPAADGDTAGGEAARQRVFVPAQWGLVPHWVKSASDAKLRAPKLVNAKSDTASTGTAFRDAWLNGQRCIVPMVAFYEDDLRTGKAVPTRIARVDGKPMGVAGLWANHALLRRYGQPGSEKSMPAILNEGAYDAWLTARPEKAKEFMRQYAAQWLTANPVEKKADKVPKGLLG
jgi:putative SOS response-associated peptidase YedK